MPIRTLLDNDAVLVIGIDETSGTGHGGPPIPHANALLIGVKDGGGSLLHRQRDEDRYFPVARGRVDWLGAGELLPQAGWRSRLARRCSWRCGHCRMPRG